jgi:mannose-6-phosphate isomerase-like protein (cupin superfamily)
MKKYFFLATTAVIFFVSGVLFSYARQQGPGYILEHEKEIAKAEPAPHGGLGNTTAYKFFSAAKDSKIDFRKRVLHKGASIGYHLQKEEEVYYIASGRGLLVINDKEIHVQAGDALLTHGGSYHGLTQEGEEDLEVIIVFEKK